MERVEKKQPSVEEREAGERLKRARLHRGFARAEDFSQKWGLNDSTYRSHESGRGVKKALPEYARLLRVRLGWLLYEEGAMTEELQADVDQFIKDYLAASPEDQRVLRHTARSFASRSYESLERDPAKSRDQQNSG